MKAAERVGQNQQKAAAHWCVTLAIRVGVWLV